MGTYTASVKYLWEIIDQIADALIALPEWEEGDATWDTTTKTLQNARRVVHHIADDIYLSLIMENGTQLNNPYYWRGLLIIFSSGWDGVAHEPNGTKYYTFAPFNAKTSGVTTVDIATADLDYRLFTWTEGFALVGIPLPNPIDTYQLSFIAVVERNTVKLYADGFTNFYMFVDFNYPISTFNTTATSYTRFGSTFKWWKYSRPFTLQSQTGAESPYDAIVSQGDDKAYFTKPITHNAADNLNPIYQPEMFMMVTNDRGLVDDDEIALPGPSTKKYQVTIKQSPNYINYLKYAIMKAE